MSKFRDQNLTQRVPKYLSSLRKYAFSSSESDNWSKNVRLSPCGPKFSAFEAKKPKNQVNKGFPNPNVKLRILALVSLISKFGFRYGRGYFGSGSLGFGRGR